MRRPGFWARVREARLFRVLLLYVGASWLILQATAILRNEFQLPRWVTPFVVLLLVIGVVIISATAWVQAHPPARAREGEVPAPWELNIKDLAESIAERRIPHLTWARAILGGVFAFSLLFGVAGLYVLLKERGGAISPVREATAAPGPGIAILPFRVVGADLELWREGMVDLLSTNLDGAAGLRKIDPRVVLSRWRTEVGEGKDAPDPQTALAVARGAGASYALIGSMVGSEREARLTAEVYDVQTGEMRATAVVEGSPDSVFALVNRLSLQVLAAGLIKGPVGVPELDLSRITTTSIPAVKAYLSGRRNLRAAGSSDAIADFTRAVEADSTFALAWYEMERYYRGRGLSSDADQAYRRAIRLADRLPEREASLLRIAPFFDYVAGIPKFEEHTTRYPDDVEGWFVLGDAYFHAGPHGFYPPESFRHAFRRTLALDPGFGQAYIHLVDDAFARGDSSTARELIARFRQIDPSSPRGIAWDLTFALAFGGSVSKGRARAALDTASADVFQLANFALRFNPDFWEALLEVSQAQLRPANPVFARRQGRFGMLMARVWRGQLREARNVLETWVDKHRRSALLNLAGYTDTVSTRQAIRALGASHDPADRFLLGALAADEHRWTDVETEIAVLKSGAEEAQLRHDSLAALERSSYGDVLRSFAALRRGDPRAAIRGLEDALPRLRVVGLGHVRAIAEVLRYEVGKLALELGDPRKAEQYFLSLQPYNFEVGTPAQFYLGEVYEALGDVEQAKLHYARFLRLWEDCDPELRPWWERGRQALERLTREDSRTSGR